MTESTTSEQTLFTKTRYALVPFPLSQKALAAKAETFMEFLRLPRDVKRTLHVPATVHRKSADGYTEKLDVPDKDRKEFFHWRPELAQKRAYREIASAYPAAQRFFAAAADIYQAAQRTVYGVFSEHFPEYVPRLFDETGDEPRLRSAVLRFLAYEPEGSHAFCAKGHFDKGFCAFALSESAPGLRIGSREAGDLRPVTHTDHTAICMPGMMFYEASNGAVKPAWHDVVHNPDEPRVNDFCARFAIVLFVELPDAHFSSWENVHTPLQ